MIAPYSVVGLIPTRNLDHIDELATSALGLTDVDIPARVLVLPEGALQNLNDEFTDQNIAEYTANSAIDVPGPETERLGALACRHNVYIVAQAKARHDHFPGIFFNVGIILNPKGEIILKHYKMSLLLPVERSASPHDVYDKWISLYGNKLQSFWPVVDTGIGRLGIMQTVLQDIE